MLSAKNRCRSMRIALAGATLFTLSAASHAGGVLDFLDPCVAAKDDYWAQRKAIMTSIDAEIKNNPNVTVTKDFRDYWIKEKRTVLRKYYDDTYGPIIQATGGNADAGFEIFWVKSITDAGGTEEVEKLIAKDFTKARELQLLKDRGAQQAELDSQKNQLYGQCPSDVGSQVFRGTVTIVGAPVGIVMGNLDGAKNEKNIITAAVRATTGVSAEAIKKHGLLGGDNSEARKACNAIAGVLGKKC
ncbi:hypothetical protein [Cupriavidus taiwanensis]|uniref:hypothetical protein n=1 Tax=Cupriavidus taiwanensis TaxID=164546 RepID=UPI000E1946A1|nr:hypothetical protein [Cupriavidus taiwanensis]SPA17239.1 exported hypothetical protein [Cupriavidus taiwanensis]